MRGRIKVLKENRNFGFIIGEDGQDYFFHFSDVKSIDVPIMNSIVEFEPNITTKGRSAINITIEKQALERPEMITIGPERIKLNSIKAYGTYYEYIPGTYGKKKRHFLQVDTYDRKSYYYYDYDFGDKIYEFRDKLDKYFFK